MANVLAYATGLVVASPVDQPKAAPPLCMFGAAIVGAVESVVELWTVKVTVTAGLNLVTGTAAGERQRCLEAGAERFDHSSTNTPMTFRSCHQPRIHFGDRTLLMPVIQRQRIPIGLR